MGPETSDCQTYVLSVAINGVKNLVSLIPSTSAISSENGFYFYYSLLDNDVTNETFYELMTPSIPTERASVRISTTFRRLDVYLKRKQTLKVFFCCGDDTLGEAWIPLDKLSDTNNNNLLPSMTNGMFPLRSSKNDHRSLACVGVSVVLRREDQPAPVVATDPGLSPVEKLADKKAVSPDTITPTASPRLVHSPPPPSSPPQQRTPKKNQNQNSRVKTRQSPEKSKNRKERKEHHFVCSVDLRSIGHMDIPQPVHCFCRYSYPFFGSSSPVLTNPPVYLQRNCEVVLPQSFCQFEFASHMETVQSTLARVPLVIEVWSRSQNHKDELIGICHVQLSNIFASSNFQERSGPVVCSEKVPIVSSNRPGLKMGVIHVVFSFEDRGEINNIKFSPRRDQTSQSTDDTPSYNPPAPPANQRQHQEDEGRRAKEYEVAMALELWRQQQEEHFLNQLKAREKERMKALADEWKQRDLEREKLLARKIQEFNLLENTLKTSLSELQLKQRQVNEEEQLLEKKKAHLADEFDRKVCEMREASKRLKEEYQHQLQIEKNKQKEVEERYQRMVEHSQELERKVKEKDNEIYALKESLVKRPEVKMQSDMNILLIEKNELERKIEAVTKSKIHYKQQWGRALRELARIKTNEQEEAKSRLKKQQQELDHMKLRYLAAEEKQMMQTEKEELDQVKDEINKRLTDLQTNYEQQMSAATDQNHQQELIENDHGDRVAKLLEERDTLLHTGVYTNDDPVISELDKEIRLMIADKNT
ncbi:centrosomal protein of 120 kDa-like [Clytia hemisphaerica]|uniref:DUF3668 domain-containing protein n=1 Tax=Clytia hemisphaerica TaxID=252671 RepID=A0A7M5XD11_9CNID